MKHFLLLLFFSWLTAANAQRPLENSSDIYQEIKRLNVLTNVLYLAAHPDDENTRLISWLENEKLARTAYLSLTRGSGGQNLIGTEKGPAMGVLRTQELIEARKIDGGEQYFSSAVDFGYSKTADETLDIWNKDEVLEDVVWTIRKFRPDVIITRFPSDERAGHGHHTASAMLAEEAFKLSANPKTYRRHLNFMRIVFKDMAAYPKEVIKSEWQAKRLLWNTSVWWDQQLPEKAAKADDYIKIDIGEYNKVLGLSYSEIASNSRSQHQSQGFGSARARGSQIEYLKHTAGDQAKNDLFEGINSTWSRVKDSDKIQELVNKLIEEYDFIDPSKSLNLLIELYTILNKRLDVITSSDLSKINTWSPIESEADFYIEQKLQDVKRLIKAVTGIHAELLAERPFYTDCKMLPIKLKLNIIARNTDKQMLVKRIHTHNTLIEVNKALELNTTFSMDYIDTLKCREDQNVDLSHPYWLNDSKKNSIDPVQQGLAENLPITEVRYEIL
ncbi:MAG: LmbE family protein, partial [Verrucomicrobia bacterium]|nr:LmbE family protein [Verrucomicrobiota bacterium]